MKKKHCPGSFFDRIKAGTNTPPAKDFFDMEYTWATTPTRGTPYPHRAQEDPVSVAKEVVGWWVVG
jgi:hypothetical protein